MGRLALVLVAVLGCRAEAEVSIREHNDIVLTVPVESATVNGKNAEIRLSREDVHKLRDDLMAIPPILVPGSGRFTTVPGFYETPCTETK